VIDLEGAPDAAAQHDLIGVEHRLVSVKPPPWLHMVEKQEPVIAPKPNFDTLHGADLPVAPLERSQPRPLTARAGVIAHELSILAGPPGDFTALNSPASI
jgi:hypothetical protein